MFRDQAVPTTWRGIGDRSGRACAGVGIGLVSECLLSPSHGGPLRGDEKRGKPTGNNKLPAVDRGWRVGLVTNIANRCLGLLMQTYTPAVRVPSMHMIALIDERSEMFEKYNPNARYSYRSLGLSTIPIEVLESTHWISNAEARFQILPQSMSIYKFMYCTTRKCCYCIFREPQSFHHFLLTFSIRSRSRIQGIPF